LKVMLCNSQNLSLAPVFAMLRQVHDVTTGA
jgi:hypothetical protein